VIAFTLHSIKIGMTDGHGSVCRDEHKEQENLCISWCTDYTIENLYIENLYSIDSHVTHLRVVV
jgi:hypothetical protein